MAYFETKNPNMGKFWSVLQWKMLVYFVAVWSILQPFGILVTIWYIFGQMVYFFPLWYVVPRKIWKRCFNVELLFFCSN
jgi:hypothetical protein